MAEFRSIRNTLSCRVKNVLETIKLRTREVQKEGVAVIKFRVNKRCSNNLSSGIVKSVSYLPEVTNRLETRFGKS